MSQADPLLVSGGFPLPIPAVLIVEDSLGDAELTALCIESTKLVVAMAVVRSVAEAAEFLATRSVTLVVADLDLPDSCGLATVRRLRGLAGDAAIIVLSGNEDEAVALEALSAGADDWIPKDELSPMLFGRVARHALDRRVALAQVAALAATDPMTGLPNRRHLLDELNRSWARQQRHGGALSVIALAPVDLKAVSDAWGSAAAASALNQIGQQLRATLTGGEFVARDGGDGFVVLAERLAAPIAAASLAEELLQATSGPLDLGEGPVSVGLCAGVVHAADASVTAVLLLASAAASALKARDGGAGAIEVARPRVLESAQAQWQLRDQVEAALDAGELSCEFQPIVDCTSRECTGAEGLMRWRRGGEVVAPPSEFIPAALDGGIGGRISRTAVEQALGLMQRLEARNPTLYVSVNVTARDLADHAFVEWVVELMKNAPAQARLRLELSEEDVLGRTEQVSAGVARLHAAGVSVSVDDFGTGLSSLGRLGDLSVDHLKIDRSFVARLPADPAAEAVARAAVACAQSLRLGSVAEGVETEQQLEAVAEFGCREAQGWLFAAAMPPDRFLDWLQQHAATAAEA